MRAVDPEGRSTAGSDPPGAVPTALRSTELAGSERFPPDHRLRRRAEFLLVQRQGRRVHTPHYVLIVLPRRDALQRLGITVTKKVAHAVGRNRAKRVLREVFRRNRELFPERCDVVVIVKSGGPTLGYEQTRAELARARRPLERAAERAREALDTSGEGRAR